MLPLHVLFTQQAGPEALVTRGAFEGLDVDDHVSVQAAVGGEGGVADIAFEGLCSCQAETSEEGFCISGLIFVTF